MEFEDCITSAGGFLSVSDLDRLSRASDTEVLEAARRWLPLKVAGDLQDHPQYAGKKVHALIGNLPEQVQDGILDVLERVLPERHRLGEKWLDGSRAVAEEVMPSIRHAVENHRVRALRSILDETARATFTVVGGQHTQGVDEARIAEAATTLLDGTSKLERSLGEILADGLQSVSNRLDDICEKELKIAEAHGKQLAEWERKAKREVSFLAEKVSGSKSAVPPASESLASSVRGASESGERLAGRGGKTALAIAAASLAASAAAGFWVKRVRRSRDESKLPGGRVQ